jgi:Domain of unknown function (DUF4386)
MTTEGIVGASPRLKARIAGALYLIIIVTAMFAEMFVRERLVVYGDAAATATNILAHEALYRYGGVAMLIALVCDTAFALIFYQLFKPVSRGLALLATFFRLMPVAILAVNLLNHFAPLVILKGAPVSASFPEGHLQALALASLHVYAYGFKIAMVFFGFNCLLLGYLIFKSTFLPRVPGVLMAVAGVCYLIWSLASLLSPALGDRLFAAYILAPCFIAELSLALWLLVVGVNVPRWKERASAEL